MPAKKTQEQIESEFLELGFEFCDVYINSNTKAKAKCFCGNYFYVKPVYIISKLTKSCGCKKYDYSDIMQDIVGQTINRLYIDDYMGRHNGKHYYNVTCECGTKKSIERSSLRTGRTKSCGCYNLERISEANTVNYSGQKFGKLTIGKLAYNNTSGKAYYNTICDCGVNKIIRMNDIQSGRTISCGCHRKFSDRRTNKLDGQRFGSLVVINLQNKTANGALTYRCKCDCGNFHNVQYSNLTSGAITTCSKCSSIDLENGAICSKPQRHVKSMTGGILNYKVGKYFVDIALVRYSQKIAIEYDCWYWHKDRLDKDLARDNFLINNGWKILHIRAGSKTPSGSQLHSHIMLLCTSMKDIMYIQLDDWRL
jgi:hypothetical protein